MKNKRLTYVLIFVTVLVWILIIYKIVNKQSGSEQFIDQNKNPKTGTHRQVNKDYELLLDYPDPFLSYMTIDKTNAVSQNTPGNKKSGDATIQFPRINFTGVVINQKTGKERINIAINGRNYLMSPGDIIEDLSLNKIYTDSIKVSYKGKPLFIKKSNN